MKYGCLVGGGSNPPVRAGKTFTGVAESSILSHPQKNIRRVALTVGTRS